MKRILVILICVLTLTSCAEKSPEFIKEEIVEPEEFRAVWISCYDLLNFDFSSKDTLYSDVKKSFQKFSEIGLNTVIVHVRAFADSIYPSELFPMSKLIFKDKIPEYDPLEIIIDIAEKFNLSFHAWINPYRISSTSDINSLSDSPITQYSSEFKTTDSGIFFNPSSLKAQALIIDGVREIISKYNVDAIHIDDYFYPTTDLSFDKTEYDVYLKNGGKLSVSDWRRENVNSLIIGIYSTIKAFNKNIEFGISPSGNIDYCYDKLYADVNLWCNSRGYADYIIPQLYYGFNNTTKPFATVLNEWVKLAGNSEIKLYGGLALYKSGTVDEFCSDEIGRKEWKNYNDVISRQIIFLRKNHEFSGFALYSSNNFFDNSNIILKNEIQNIINVL